MQKFDRLSALVEHLAVTARIAGPGEGNLVIYGRHGLPEGAELMTGDEPSRIEPAKRLFEAQIDWAGRSNPVFASLAPGFDFPARESDETRRLLQMVVFEADAQRCGSGQVLNRLCEILIIQLLRTAIERGCSSAGMLAGLADPKISRALVAVHEDPGRTWSNNDLAEEAGMSLSRFCEHFTRLVGETPQSYVRRWRLTIAHRRMAQGQRVHMVARQLGYKSGEAFSRAFQREFGISPLNVRMAERAVRDVTPARLPVASANTESLQTADNSLRERRTA